MSTKEKLKEQIDKLPEEEFTIDELIDRLVFIEKLEGRIEISLRRDSSISNEEMKAEFEKWSS